MEGCSYGCPSGTFNYLSYFQPEIHLTCIFSCFSYTAHLHSALQRLVFKCANSWVRSCICGEPPLEPAFSLHHPDYMSSLCLPCSVRGKVQFKPSDCFLMVDPDDGKLCGWKEWVIYHLSAALGCCCRCGAELSRAELRLTLLKDPSLLCSLISTHSQSSWYFCTQGGTQ